MKENMNYNGKGNTTKSLSVGDFLSDKAKGYISIIIERVKAIYVSLLASTSLVCFILGFISTDVLMGELYKGVALMACLLSIQAMSKIRSVRINEKSDLSN